MIFMPSRSTADYLFEQAEQYFRRSRSASSLRAELEALGNALMGVELDIELQNLAKAATPPFPLRGRDDYGQAAF
jgi:hypothetical protein